MAKKYINVDEFCGYLIEHRTYDIFNYANMVNDGIINGLLEYIDEMPEPDVVEVVRCRDCEYWDPGSPMATVIPAPCRCRLRRETDATTAEDFCSYGRRKEKNDE